MERTKQTLMKFGLTENEIDVYLACVSGINLSPHRISVITKIPRTTVYDVLMSLSLKKLITLQQSDGFTKQQTRVTAVNPSMLRKIIRDKKDELDELEIDVIDILPELKTSFMKRDSDSNFNFYSGIDGFKKVYLDLDIVHEMIWNPLISSDFLGRDETRSNVDKHVEIYGKQKKKTRELTPLTEWTKHVLSIQTKRNPAYVKNRNMRYIEGSFLSITTWIAIAKNRVAMGTVDGDEAWGLVINSKSLASTLRSLFELQWLTASVVDLDLVKSFGADDLYRAAKRKGVEI